VVVRIAGMVVTFGFLAWIAGGFLGIPMAVVWLAGVGVVLTVIMSRTTFGRSAYLVGSNREAARFSGISVRRQVFLGFVLMGAVYGVGGVLLTSRLGSAAPSMGQSLELDAIAAAVIGGTSLAGGVGTVVGAMGGALLLATIDNGMSLMNVSSFAQLVVKGLVLLAALAIDAFVNRRAAGRA
jgi:D-xylose transport system permease protein